MSNFNPKARWDRRLPATEEIEQGGPARERIDVLAWCKNGSILPRMFIWGNKKYRIKKVTYTWRERQGQETISYFSVDTGTGLYQISFNSVSLGWRLDKIIE